MAKLEFLQNLKTARNLFFHEVRTDHRAGDPKKLKGQLERAAIWLTPSAVRGFNIRDFPELSARDKLKLSENVERFRRVAMLVPPDQSAEPRHLREAMEVFLEIVKTLESHIPVDGEIVRIQNILKEVRFPTFVRNWDFELGADFTGEPAVWVWVFVDDKAPEQPDFRSIATEIERKVKAALNSAGIARWPFVRFRTVGEQRALRGLS